MPEERADECGPARRMKAQMFFGDEAGVRSDHYAGTT